MRKPVLLTIAFAVAALLAVGCGGGGIPKGAIATVGSGVVTKADFDWVVNQAKAQAKSSKQTFPTVGSYAYNQYAASVVDYLVQLQLINQEAAKAHITVTDKQVADRVASIEKQYGKTKLDAALKAQGLTRTDLNRLERDQLMSEAVYNHIVGKNTVTDAQALAYYNAHKSQYSTPEQRHTRHILVKTKAEALKVRALLVAGQSWKSVAAKYSIDPGSKKNGGDLGQVTPGTMVPPFDKAAFSLPANTISQPVQSTYGWHIIEVLAITKAKVQTFAEAKALIVSQLQQTNGQAAWTKWLNKAKKDANIKYASGYDPVQLRKTKPPSASPSPAGTITVSPSPSGSASPETSPSPSATP